MLISVRSTTRSTQLERARSLFEAKLGLEHSDTLVAMSSLANAYNHAGRPADAIPLFEQTITLMERRSAPTTCTRWRPATTSRASTPKPAASTRPSSSMKRCSRR